MNTQEFLILWETIKEPLLELIKDAVIFVTLILTRTKGSSSKTREERKLDKLHARSEKEQKKLNLQLEKTKTAVIEEEKAKKELENGQNNGI